jgi:hypothetical protein
MTTMWNTNTLSIGELLGMIRDSKLALPQFQRLSVWGKTDWVPFLTTVLLDRPTGTLLLLEVGANNQDFAPRSIDGAPPPAPASLKWLLLDGQQRSTTLFHAFEVGFEAKNKGRKEFVLDVKSALERGSLADGDLDFVSSGTVLPPAEMAQKGLIALKTLLDSGNLLGWQVAYATKFYSSQEVGLKQLPLDLDQVIPGFRSINDYKFPVLEIKETTPLDVVVDIFEGMNRRGQRLNQYDLMAARLYKKLPSGKYYDLREEFETYLDAAPNLQHMGVDEDEGMLPLQLIAMQISRLDPPLRPTRLKGLNNRDVLELPPEQIIGLKQLKPVLQGLSLESAVRALEEASDFLRTHCGVQGSQLLPQLSMLLPIADQFLKPKDKRLSAGQMKKWFFSSGLAIHYYGSVNSFAERDCKELSAWAKNSNETPLSIARMTKEAVEALDLRQPMSREGNILGTTIMAILVSDGALDWESNPVGLAGLQEKIEFHHTIPEKILKRILKSKDGLKPIANMTPITARRNASLGEQAPTQVKSDLAKDAEAIMTSHMIDMQLWIQADTGKKEFESYLIEREKDLKKMAIRTLGL